MINLLKLGGIAFLLISCNQKAENPDSIPDKTVQEVDATLVERTYSPEDTEIWEPKPDAVTFDETGIPSDALVLFDGTNLDAWQSATKEGGPAAWQINPDGSLTVTDRAGDIETKQEFGDVQLHLEWRSDPNNTQSGQNRSNSGVFLQNRYEVQILNSNDNDTYVNGMVGSIYKQAPPLVKAIKPTGDWNTYDIIFHAPQFDDQGKRTQQGTITVLLNDVLIQDHFPIEGSTEYIGMPKNEAHGPAPIKLQDHGDKSGVRFRNIWVRSLD